MKETHYKNTFTDKFSEKTLTITPTYPINLIILLESMKYFYYYYFYYYFGLSEVSLSKHCPNFLKTSLHNTYFNPHMKRL